VALSAIEAEERYVLDCTDEEENEEVGCCAYVDVGGWEAAEEGASGEVGRAG
jgi:hypothetical protein